MLRNIWVWRLGCVMAFYVVVIGETFYHAGKDGEEMKHHPAKLHYSTSTSPPVVEPLRSRKALFQDGVVSLAISTCCICNAISRLIPQNKKTRSSHMPSTRLVSRIASTRL